jgi:dihydropteroate synthase
MNPGMKKLINADKSCFIRCRGIDLTLERIPLVMGILNVTPDSFSDGGRFLDGKQAADRALQMARDGADIIDIGGESTRPGSKPVPAGVEMERVLPVIEAIKDNVSIPISIDTRKAAVAAEALALGCHMINDVTACQDPDMPDVAMQFSAPLIIMHMKGEPETMQDNPTYEDVVAEVGKFLGDRAELLKSRGVADDQIIIDPGIGFGKRFEDNLELLRNIGKLRSLGYPVLVGGSRKRFLGTLLDTDTDHRLAGSLAVAARCWSEGVEIIRVHDVKETRDLLTVLHAMEAPNAFVSGW